MCAHRGDALVAGRLQPFSRRASPSESTTETTATDADADADD
jgi:hypothetical protein